MIKCNDHDCVTNFDELIAKINQLEMKEVPNGIWKMALYLMFDETQFDLDFYYDSFDSVVTFDSKLLLSYIVSIMNKHEDNGFVFYEDVLCNKNENINQKLINYLSHYGTDPLLPFCTYCTFDAKYYHVILPNENYIKTNLDFRKTLHEIPIICLPSNSNVTIFNSEGCLCRYLEQPPYLKEYMKDLVNQVIRNYDQLETNEVIKQLLKRQNN